MVKKIESDDLNEFYKKNSRALYNKIRYFFEEEGISEKWLANQVFPDTSRPVKSLRSFLGRLETGENVYYISLFKILRILSIEYIQIK